MTQRFNQPRRAKRASIHFNLIAFPALLLTTAGWLGGCDRLAAATSTDAHAKTGAATTPAIAVRAVAVRTLVVRRGTLRAELSYVGIVRPRRQVKVAARVGGTVARQLMEEGDTVKAGDVLVHIEAPELQAKMASLRAEADRVRALERQACRVARTDRALVRQGALPRARADASVAQCKSAQAAVRAVSGRRHELGISVGRRQVKAPVAGRVLRWLVEPGETVGPGRPLVLLATGASELEILATDTDVARGIDVNSVVRIHHTDAAGQTHSYVSRVVRVAPMAVGPLRHVALRVTLPKELAKATPGTALDARLLLAEQRDASIVPLRAIIRTAEAADGSRENALFLAFKAPGEGSGAHAERRVVRLGLHSRGQVAILSALPQDAVVITSNLNTLRDGQPLFTVRERSVRQTEVK